MWVVSSLDCLNWRLKSKIENVDSKMEARNSKVAFKRGAERDSIPVFEFPVPIFELRVSLFHSRLSWTAVILSYLLANLDPRFWFWRRRWS